MSLEPLFESFGIMMSQLEGFFRGKVGFLCGMEMFFHLFYNMFRFSIVLNFKVCGGLADLMSVPADRTKLPALEPVNIGKCLASRAPDDEVHGNRVMCFIPIKIYRPPDTQKNNSFLMNKAPFPPNDILRNNAPGRIGGLP
jgi:hypothetical protein